MYLTTAMPFDFITHGTYWVVGHMHLFLTGTIAFGFVGMIYYMFPYITGRMYNEKWAKFTLLAFMGNSTGLLYTTLTWTMRECQEESMIIRQNLHHGHS